MIGRWDGGVGWIAHPEERGRRASHAIRGEDGDVGVFDPLDAPGVDDLLAGSRRRFPRALLTAGWTQLRAGLDAL